MLTPIEIHRQVWTLDERSYRLAQKAIARAARKSWSDHQEVFDPKQDEAKTLVRADVCCMIVHECPHSRPDSYSTLHPHLHSHSNPCFTHIYTCTGIHMRAWLALALASLFP